MNGIKIITHQKEKGRKYMGQRIYFNFVNVRKYLRVNKETAMVDEREEMMKSYNIFQ